MQHAVIAHMRTSHVLKTEYANEQTSDPEGPRYVEVERNERNPSRVGEEGSRTLS